MKSFKLLLILISSASIFGQTNIERLKAIQKLNTTMELVENYYVDDINFTDIVDKSIQGLLQNLDAHSSFMNESTYDNLKIHTDGEFGGLGIQVTIRDKVLTIISPIDDTPAFKKGLKAEDIILKINDKSTLNMTIDEAVSIMRGKKGTDIELTIVRKGEVKPLVFEITRDIIKLESVYTKTIEDENILYIRVSNFDKKVTKEVKKSLEKHNKIDGVILDLRNNPGGLLPEAIGLSDIFIANGIIVSQKGKIKHYNQDFNATDKGTYKDVSLVALVNGGSASASEIVAGALQDHKRAIVIGEKTFGKGSVQQVHAFSMKEAVKITIARYYLPSGRTIQAEGVTPDIIVHSGKVPVNENDFTIKESELKKHLNSELKKLDNTDDKKVSKEDNKTIITQKNVLNDIQLKSAIDTIKILNISKGNK
ncbi:MAG: Carboxyl-terminal protease (EC [uncultured Campylobacterales bacterium]|uniref:Carboxyl-terminal protease (EC) n=1 Tax=uncultured Campylobacterales bacterium TaxID=352960 RepID=A0A6S6SBR6_9BACT|nr:MAG: Carboxyl-terminal protease (EC [uncultured Campylobacterales bacterium]